MLCLVKIIIWIVVVDPCLADGALPIDAGSMKRLKHSGHRNGLANFTNHVQYADKLDITTNTALLITFKQTQTRTQNHLKTTQT